jgi:GT2 family glycosyltransferase
MLAPNYRNPAGNKLVYDPEQVWQVLVNSVTSGSLVAISAVKKVGGMREPFFIEGIDIEFSLLSCVSVVYLFWHPYVY